MSGKWKVLGYEAVVWYHTIVHESDGEAYCSDWVLFHRFFRFLRCSDEGRQKENEVPVRVELLLLRLTRS
jgi:hypothetical protein